MVQGIQGKSNFTCTNISSIELPLIIDLRPPTVKPENPAEVDCLKIGLLTQDAEL